MRHHQDIYWFEIEFKFRPSGRLYRPRSSLFCTARLGNFLDSTYSCHYNFLAHYFQFIINESPIH
jgi:hypothetical protein